MLTVDLSKYKNPPWHDKERSFVTRAVWHILNAVFLQNPLNPSSKVKIVLLRAFGAKVGKGVLLKPAINIKSPWRVEIGDYSMIGERAWLDSVAPIRIGANVVVSQDAYLCTGNHDWTDPAFGLIEAPLVIEDGAWVGARATILPGARVASHAIISGGSVLSKETEPYMIYAGNPALPVKKRVLTENGRAEQIAARHQELVRELELSR